MKSAGVVALLAALLLDGCAAPTDADVKGATEQRVIRILVKDVPYSSIEAFLKSESLHYIDKSEGECQSEAKANPSVVCWGGGYLTIDVPNGSKIGRVTLQLGKNREGLGYRIDVIS